MGAHWRDDVVAFRLKVQKTTLSDDRQHQCRNSARLLLHRAGGPIFKPAAFATRLCPRTMLTPNCSFVTPSASAFILQPVAKKVLTLQQAETAKKRAGRFVSNVMGDEDRADDIEDETLDEWLNETGRKLKSNPQRKKKTMAASNTATKSDLQDQIDQISDMVADALDPVLSREEVVQRLQDIDEVINGDDDDDDSDDDGSDDDDDDDNDPDLA